MLKDEEEALKVQTNICTKYCVSLVKRIDRKYLTDEILSSEV
jgi:hypothetical protein